MTGTGRGLDGASTLAGQRRTKAIAYAALYEEHGVRLAEGYEIVSVGSRCRRQASAEIGYIFCTLDQLDLPLHGVGVKLAGLRSYGRYLVTADSMAWSYAGQNIRARRRHPQVFKG